MTAEVFHAVVHFAGRVQGVGFRYQALQVAREYTVTGYVQNLPDGRVRLEAEGDETEVGDFVAAVEERMTGYIRKTERSAGKRAAQFREFAIR
jgi:acylphosphatase